MLAYNGLGQRVLPAGTVRYLYGPGGRLLAQTDASGEALDEYIYLNGRPLAVLRHDQDDDGVSDDRDDCIAVPNGPLHPDAGGHSQRDTSGDGYGNLCDADFDHNGIVNFADLAYIKAHFGTSDPNADLDGNGIVNFADLAITKSLFGKAPGPSGLHGEAGPPQLLYVHTDALGAPVALSNAAGTVVWQASYTPFGQATINPDPDGDGKKVTFNLRFPGQYYDRESGLYYNYFRDYDPTTGRYVESDPIGLQAGTQTYAYTDDSPLIAIDPFGLIRWTGTFDLKALIIGFGAGVGTFHLTSACVDGKRAVVTVKFIGGGAGIGPKILPGSQDRGNISLNDPYSGLDPTHLEGRAGTLNLGATIGNFSEGCSRIRLGSAYSQKVNATGLDVGASILFGTSRLTSVKYESCGCPSGGH